MRCKDFYISPHLNAIAYSRDSIVGKKVEIACCGSADSGSPLSGSTTFGSSTELAVAGAVLTCSEGKNKRAESYQAENRMWHVLGVGRGRDHKCPRVWGGCNRGLESTGFKGTGRVTQALCNHGRSGPRVYPCESSADRQL